MLWLQFLPYWFCWIDHDGWIIAWICESVLVCLHDGIIIVYNIEWFIMMPLFDFDNCMNFWFNLFNCLSSCSMSFIHLPYLFITYVCVNSYVIYCIISSFIKLAIYLGGTHNMILDNMHFEFIFFCPKGETKYYIISMLSKEGE